MADALMVLGVLAAVTAVVVPLYVKQKRAQQIRRRLGLPAERSER